MPPIARPWFRLYSDILDNIKVESLSDKLAAVVESALKRGRQVTWEVIDTIH